MHVAETKETLDYIKGSKKPNKVRNIHAIHTYFYKELLRLRVFVCPSPSIDLSVGVQMTSRAPLCLCSFRCLIERKHERRQRELGVWSSLEVRWQSSQLAWTFGAHRGARLKTLSHSQAQSEDPSRWETRGKDPSHRSRKRASLCNRSWRRCSPFKKRWRHQEWIKNVYRLIWPHRKPETKNCAGPMRNYAGIYSNRQGNVCWRSKRRLHHPELSRCRFRSQLWASCYQPRSWVLKPPLQVSKTQRLISWPSTHKWCWLRALTQYIVSCSCARWLAQGATRRAQVDLQPLVVSYLGNRYTGTFPFGDTTDEVPHGHHRVLHEVDRGQASGADDYPQDPALCVEEHSQPFRSTETFGVW